MTPAAGRILALDLGDARIGLALTDPLGITAQPAGAIESEGVRRDVERLARLAREREVGQVIVGHPVRLSGEAGTRARAAEEFAARLRKALPGVTVELWDERLTTAEAERVLIAADVPRARRRRAVDALSAVILLRSFMDARAARIGEDPP